MLNANLSIDGGDMGVMNDTESREDSSEEQSRRNNVPDDYDEPEKRGETLPRTGAYGKAKPTIMDNIRSLGEKKRGNPQPSGKAADIEI
ncbi:MAG: hypothetical protein LBU32_17230 [Clostridiales bacterium]|nr:hypothetical protein [Clostridiales bacterium]